MAQLTPMIVDAIRDEADAPIRALDLVSPTGSPLAPFPAGAHIGLEWAPRRLNSYSLTNDGFLPDRYSIAVSRHDDGKGGSEWVHRLRAGDEVLVTPPRSAFLPSARARHHILVSGGIGITPMIGHARWHRLCGSSFEAFHVGPDGPLVRELDEITGGRLRRFRNRNEFWAEFLPALRAARFGSEVYTCGPLAMIEAVADAAAGFGWPAGRIHAEDFTPKPTGGRPFVARAVRSGASVAVGESQSLLEALEGAGIPVGSMCRKGVCGECRVAVLAGAMDHHDDYLSDDERRAGDAIMTCVSRAAGDKLELAL
jgi:ferredoxin-NADP reductase